MSTGLTQQDFERSTKKYWLRNDYVDTFIEIIAKHLPIQVWNNRSASEITSVYFDNEDLRFYENRLLKKDGAALIRLRLYEGTEQVFVEKKVHYEEQASTKKRFFLQRNDVDAYLAGSKEPLGQQLNSNDGEGGSASELYLDIQNLITSNKMVPSIQTLYVRRAYQFPNDTGVRVTLDTNLRMGLMLGGKWYDQPSKSFSFPFSIMEIKLDGTVPEPEWLSEMKQRMELSKVSSFSKYVHGCYQLISSQACRKWSPTWWAFKDDQNCSSPLKFQPLEDISSRSFKKFCGLTQAIYSAVKFGMIDLLHEQPQSALALSATLQTHPESTKVLLDFLAYFKLLRKDDRGDYHVTDKGDVLTTNNPSSFAQQALACGDMYDTFGENLLSELKGNVSFSEDPSVVRPLDIIDSIICWNNSSMQTLLQSFIIVQAIYILVYFNIPHLIDNGATTLASLAEKTKTDQTALKRFMKFILKLGLFSEKDGFYVLTRLSEKLLPSSTMRPYCLMCGNEYYKAWGALPNSVKTGISAFESVFGMSLNQYLETNEQFLKYHTADQGSKTAKASDPILRIYDHAWAKNIIDIGGGDGAHLLAIKKKFPQSQGTLLETQLMVDRCKEQLTANNIQTLAGDFFKSVPQGGDLYVLKKVLYCWKDEECVQILRNVHSAIPANGKALIIDFMGTASDAPKLSVDNLWYIVKWGRPLRTEELYRKLAQQSGFKVTNMQQVNNDLYCFELVPVRKN